MLPRTQVFVDTSYLLASFYNSWETGARAQLEIDLPEVVAVLGQMIQDQLGQPIHRQLWYDGLPDSGPHRYQRALRTCDGVLLRAGQLIEWGERRTQKAVDTRLVADMVLAGVRGTCTDMVLVSGDADMIPGVQEASMAGVRVHLYGFGWDSMSSALRHACDTTTILDPREDFAECMQLQVLEGPLPPQVRPKPIGDAEPLDDTSPCSVPGTTLSHGNRAQPRPSSPCDSSSATDSSEQPPAAGESTSESAAMPGDTSAEKQDTPESPAPPEQPATSENSADSGEHQRNRSDSPLLTRPGEPAETDDDRPYSGTESTESEQAATSTTEPCADAPATLSTPSAAAGLTPAHLSGDTPEPVPQPTPADIAQNQQQPAAEKQEPESSPAPQSEAARESSTGTENRRSAASTSGPVPKPTPKPTPKPSMMARRRKLRSRYVPLPNEVWASAGFQTPFDVGQQYASWWFDNAASSEQRDQAHMLSGGGLPPEIDRPLLQFACETLHEYTLTESQRVSLRDGFHSGIRGVLINLSGRDF
ncbi:NYN domain-containing protein [Corynebacterium sp. TAE3-ERU30]|uniref:NYN domain-containing protein n=1 Tax=Corynebacterium sp. TAE3-ERU30 TaxID=2849496 RepID=UPI001C48D090|nr:NYN domain-containing protein [Corynebacterium sp. TAE3-ERU30]MBV7282386.1 NYN domain-containing protein [Corynebacterium sp. TAE3-ERU30]